MAVESCGLARDDIMRASQKEGGYDSEHWGVKVMCLKNRRGNKLARERLRLTSGP